MKKLQSTISASEARSNFYTLLDNVANKLKRYTITRRGNAQVVLMHPDEVASWEETMDVLSNKKLVSDIINSEKELKAGKTVSEDKLLKKIGLEAKDLK
jgi:prevent-host-death family protein